MATAIEVSLGYLTSAGPLYQQIRGVNGDWAELTIVGMYVAGCAAATVNVSRPVTASSLGSTAVLPFSGHSGDLFSDLIANELLSRNVTLIERTRLAAVLEERNLQLNDVVSGKVDFTTIGKGLGVDTLVFGSVNPITVYMSGAQSGKVAAASLRLISVQSGRVLSSATYNNNTDLLLGSPTYPEVAAKLVEGLLKRH